MNQSHDSWQDVVAFLYVKLFDVIDRIEGVVFTFWNADWCGTYYRRGVLGLALEFIKCVLSLNVTPHEFKRGGGISGQDMEDMLGRHGVAIGDRGFGRNPQYLSFITKDRQGRWARWLIDQYQRGYEPPVRRLPRRRRKWKR